jgi:hypothetical protein
LCICIFSHVLSLSPPSVFLLFNPLSVRTHPTARLVSESELHNCYLSAESLRKSVFIFW